MAGSALQGRRDAAHPLADQWRQLTSFLVINLGYGLVNPQIDLSAHVGGLVAGGVLGMVLLGPGASGGRVTRGRLVTVTSVGLVAILLGAAALDHWRGPEPEAYEEARNQYAAALRTSEGDKDAASERAHRKEVLADSVKQGGATAEAYQELGVLYAKAGRYDEALATFQNGLVHYPGDQPLLMSLGAIAYNLRRFDLAISADSTLATMRPDSEIRLDLQAAYMGQAGQARAEGMREKAQDAYRQVVSIGLGSAYTAEARRMLDSLEAGGRAPKP
jgi:tetratricopeptide (TPR) repeat protein